MPNPFTFELDEWRALTRPAVLPLWLRAAKKFLTAALLGLLFTFLLYPSVLRAIYPPPKAPVQESGGLFGGIEKLLKGSPKKSPQWKLKHEASAGYLYYLFLAIGAAGLWRAVAPAAAQARARAAHARTLAESEVGAGRWSLAATHYGEALRWESSAHERPLLMRTLDDVRNRIVQQTMGPAPSSRPQGDAGGAGGVGQTLVTTAGHAVTVDGTAILAPGARPDHVGPGQRYHLKRLLGKGGMGEVHEALDTSLERIVALKKLPTHLANDAQFLTRFNQEAKALAKLSHPAVVQVFDIIRDAAGVYISLEFVPGGDLQDRIDKRGPLAPADALALARPMAEGLAYAHRQGIVHRDIKPLNILITSDGQPKITDFGLAKMAAATQLTMEGSVMGSPHYMSPEQAQGKTADARSDIYSFGAMLYFMLTGRPPFDGELQQILLQHITSRVPSIPSIPPVADALVQKCTDPDPDRRYQNADELAAAIRGAEGALHG